MTDERLRELIAESREGRQNAHKRAIRTDAEAALRGNVVCRDALRERAATIRLPDALVTAIESYLTTEWTYSIGPLNAVATIGEQLVALYSEATGIRAKRSKT